ncbi:hypothetical protein MMC21_007110 [Puttea exsequens]|nr:hypothetical protein [Puttea exsequens]
MRHDWCRIFPDLVLVLCSQVALSQTQVIETITIATERFVIDPENIVLHSSTLLPGSQGVLIDGQVVSIDAQNDLFVDGTEIITHEHLYSPANSYGGTTAVAGLDTSISLQYGSRVSSVRRSDGPTSKIGFGSSMYSSPGSQSGPTTMGSSTGRLTLSQSGSKASNVQRYETQVTREEFIGHKSSSTGSLSSPSTSESDLDTFNSLTSSLAAPILTVPGSEATNAAQGPQNSASASRSASATLTPWTSGSLGSPRTGPSHHTAIATIQASKSTAHPRSQSASAWTSAIATPHGGATATSASSRGSRSSSASLLSPSITAGPTFSIPFASINPTGAIASSNAVALAGLLIAFSNDNRDRISAIIKDPVKKKNLIDNVHSLETMALQLHSDEGGSNPSCDQTGFLPPLVEDIGCMAKDLTALKGSLVVKNPEIAAIEGAIDAVGEEAEQVERDNEDDDDDDDDEEKTTSTDDGKKTATKYNGNTTTSQLRESTTVSKPDRRKTISTTLIESHISTSSSTIAVITAGLSSQTATRTSSIAGPVSEASYALNISPIYPLDAVLDESADVVAIALNVVGDALIAEFGNGTSVASGFTTRTTSKPNTSPSIKWTTSSSSIGSSSKPNSSLSATRTISPSSPAPDSELSYVLYTGSIYPQDVAFDEPASVTAVAFGPQNYKANFIDKFISKKWRNDHITIVKIGFYYAYHINKELIYIGRHKAPRKAQRANNQGLFFCVTFPVAKHSHCNMAYGIQ